MSQQYGIIFTNNSGNSGDVCCYQQGPEVGNIMSLVWFVKRVHPHTKVDFHWTEEYHFVWRQTIQLMPGIDFPDGQTVEADSKDSNSITLDYIKGEFQFIDQKRGPYPDSLYINASAAIPDNQAVVGVGMSGADTFLVQASPNMTYVFSLHPEYWLAFGNFVAGQVLDTKEITNTVGVSFPPGVSTMHVTLNPDNSWTVSSAPDARNVHYTI